MLARKSAILQIYPSYSVVQKFAIFKRNQTLIEVREKLIYLKKKAWMVLKKMTLFFQVLKLILNSRNKCMRIMRTIIQLSGFISLWLLALVKQKREKGQYLKYHVKFFKRLFIINILSIIIFITHKKRKKFSDRIMKVKLPL